MLNPLSPLPPPPFPHPPRCVREWLRACVLCLSVWESELCLGRRMRALRLRIAPCNEGIAHYNTDGGQQQPTTNNNNNEQRTRRGTTRAGHVVANQFPIGNGAFLPANHEANWVQCGQYRQQQAAAAAPGTWRLFPGALSQRAMPSAEDWSIDRSIDRWSWFDMIANLCIVPV